MKTVTIKSFITKGLKAVPVTIETSITDGIGIHLLGLQDAQVREVLLRTCTAIQAIGHSIPGKKIIINVKAADGGFIKDDASNLDLPIAISILTASEAYPITQKHLDEYAIVGELSLDGNIRCIRSGYTISLAADKVIIPTENATRLQNHAGIKGMHKVFAASNIANIPHLFHDPDMYDIDNTPLRNTPEKPEMEDADFRYVKGAEGAKQALIIAAAGGHSIQLVGGKNKTYLLRCLRTILPELSEEAFIENEKIREACGIASTKRTLLRPFRMPHYSSTLPAMIGGGARPLPGEVSLASNGILALTELEEWPTSVLKAIRSVKDDRKVKISRLDSSTEYPADFLLAGTSKACPCGHTKSECLCSDKQVADFRSKLQHKTDGLFDMKRWVAEFTISDENRETDSATIRRQVEKAREIQKERYAGLDINTNGQLPLGLVETFCVLTPEAENALSQATQCHKNDDGSLIYSTDCIRRIRKVARTIADLNNSDVIKATHIYAAMNYFPQI